MVLLTLLKTFWKPLLAFAVVALLVWQVWSAVRDYGQERYDAGYSTRSAEYKAAEDKQKDQHIINVEKREVRTNELVTDLGQKLDAIAARPVGKPVWMCPQPASVSTNPGPAPDVSTSRADEEAQSRPPGQVRDIGPGTRDILDDGDSAIEQLTSLQAWVTRECLRPPTLPN